jgi:hypothetical protein
MSAKTWPLPRRQQEQQDRPEPQDQAHRRHLERPGERRAGVVRQPSPSAVSASATAVARRGPVPAAAGEEGRVAGAPAEVADQGGGEHDDGIGTRGKKMATVRHRGVGDS